MFVGEAPGAEEDRQGLPFVGRAGQLLNQLLDGIGMTREDVFIANVLKSRPPGNRDPLPDEIEACWPYLERQIQLIEPRVIATLGNFATKLLTGNQTGITRVRGHAAGPRARPAAPCSCSRSCTRRRRCARRRWSRPCARTSPRSPRCWASRCPSPSRRRPSRSRSPRAASRDRADQLDLFGG